MKPLLQIDNIQKYYGNKGNVTKAIDHIHFNVNEGEFVGIMGPSGSGKTTLLNCISTLDSVSSGHIYIDGADITALNAKELARFRKDKLGFIFQDFNILDTLTGFENIALALTIRKVSPKFIEKQVMTLAQSLEIQDILNKYPYELSGGQKQRIACARAMITNPSLILADEPTGALDSKSARILLESIEYLNTQLGATIMMVTHDAFTASYASRILFIKDGRIFNELVRGNDSRKTFFNRIIEVVTLLGGDTNNVL